MNHICCPHCHSNDEYYETDTGFDNCTDCRMKIFVGRKIPEIVKYRHPKSDHPDDFEQCFIWPQCIKAEYQEGFFMTNTGRSSVIHLGVELWFSWRDFRGHLQFPEDYEIGRSK
jgi:hypothetical protein